MTLSLERINKAREAGYDDDKIIESIERRDPEFGSRIKKARESGYDSASIMQSIEKRLNTPVNTKPPVQSTPIQSNSPEIPDTSKLAQEPNEDAYKDLIKPKEYTPAELKKLSVQEKLDWIEENNRYREYLTAKGTTKGALSGLSLGLSEKVPSLKHEEDDIGFGFGEFAGSALPITKLAKVFSAPLVKLAQKAPHNKQALEAFAHMTGMFGTGAAYEGAKHTIKEGELPTPEDVIKHGAQWAALDGVLRLVGLGGKLASKLSQSKNASEDINKLIESVDLNEANLDALKKDLESSIDKINEGKIDVSTKLPEEVISETVEKATPKDEFSTEKPQSQADQAIKAPKEKVEVEAPKKQEISPEAIIETTGESAEKRIQYIQDQKVDQSNAIIEAAKAPGESLKKMGEATNTAIFNFMAPLEKAERLIPVAERASTRIKLAQSSASEINSVLENGIFSNQIGQFEHHGLKGAYGELTWKRLNKGLKHEEYSLQDLDTYRVSRAALRRQGEGKKTGVDTSVAKKDVERLRGKYGPIDQRIRDYNNAVLETYGKDLIGKDKIGEWKEKYYAPLFRVMDSGNNPILRAGSLQPKQPFYKFKGSERKIIPPSESDPYNTSMLISNARKNESILQYKKLVQKGEVPGKIKGSKNEALPSELLDELELDGGLKEVAENLYNQTRKNSYTPRKNVLRGWEDGKPFEIEVPEDIYNVFSSLAPQDRGGLAKFISASNRLFSRGISLSPKKATSIFARDALSSLIYSRTGSNPISVVEALGDIYGDKKVYKEFLALGGDVYAARLAGRIERAKKIEELMTIGKEGPVVPLDKMMGYLKKYPEFTSNVSMAVPLAEYKRALAKYGESAEGRLMAAMEARSVTYDPTRKGGSKIVQELGNYVPFWNVSLQELSILGRYLKKPETWVKGIMGLSIPTLMLKMINDDNPEYKELTPEDKAAYWHIFSGDKHLRVSIPWLLGTTFKVGPEFFFDLAKGNGKEGWQGLRNNFLDNLTGDIPPLFQSYVEQTTNRTLPSPLATFFGGESNAPPVVPKRLEGLPANQQYTSKTSQLARWFGGMWGVSPIKLERLIKTNTGTLGAEALALVDEIAYATGLAEDKRPAQREANYLLLGHFVSNSPPSRTKYANEFYKLLDENRRANAGEKRGGDRNEGKKRYAHLGSYNSRISKKFQEYRSIEEDSKVNASRKKQLLDQKQKEINALYKEAVEKVK